MHIGVIGGGQLSRMLAEAGFPANLEFTFLDPSPDACAGKRGRLLVGAWEDEAALRQLAGCDRVTFDFENVPDTVLDGLSREVIVRPPPSALSVSQDRLKEKMLFEALGLPVPRFAAVATRAELAEAIAAIGLPAVLKTRRLGYDGKGQALLRHPEDLEHAWRRLGEFPLILEQWVDFAHECALSAVRDAQGEIRFYPLVWTWHKDGILRAAMSPCAKFNRLQSEIEKIVRTILEHFDYVGVLTLELFVTEDGILLNEFAPRVHNSAHWTIEGAVTSQFENHLRAVCDWPLGDTAATGCSLMINFMGAMPARAAFLAIPGLAWHDYGKAPRPGRKVGHCTLTAADAGLLGQRLPALQRLVDPALAEPLSSLFGNCR